MRLYQKKHKIYINQVLYLKKVLRKFNLTSTYVISTPLPEGYQLLSHNGPINAELCSRYQTVIEFLLYIMLETHLDIAYAVIYLFQFCVNPLKEHLDKTLHICRYLASTKNYLLVYNNNKEQSIKEYINADWVSNPTT